MFDEFQRGAAPAAFINSLAYLGQAQAHAGAQGMVHFAGQRVFGRDAQQSPFGAGNCHFQALLAVEDNAGDLFFGDIQPFHLCAIRGCEIIQFAVPLKVDVEGR